MSLLFPLSLPWLTSLSSVLFTHYLFWCRSSSVDDVNQSSQNLLVLSKVQISRFHSPTDYFGFWSSKAINEPVLLWSSMQGRLYLIDKAVRSIFVDSIFTKSRGCRWGEVVGRDGGRKTACKVQTEMFFFFRTRCRSLWSSQSPFSPNHYSLL